jgi:putative effector of murein hydrolase LrgA (UPF0299 family)
MTRFQVRSVQLMVPGVVLVVAFTTACCSKSKGTAWMRRLESLLTINMVALFLPHNCGRWNSFVIYEEMRRLLGVAYDQILFHNYIIEVE